MKNQKLIKHARDLYDQMEYKKFDNGIERVTIKSNCKNHQELLDLTFKVSEQTNLSMDSTYSFTLQALNIISDSMATTENELNKAIDNIEADIFTSDLMEWLQESVYHVHYLTQAIDELNTRDGFKLLRMAQQLAKEEVYNIILKELRQ